MFETSGPDDKLGVIVLTEEVLVILEERFAPVKLIEKGAIVEDRVADDVVELEIYGELVD